MAHAARIWSPSDLYHAALRGLGKGRIFTSVSDRDLFLDLLDGVVSRHRWALYSWCLMGTHAHLVVRAPRAELSRGMHELKSRYARQFNLVHYRRGSLFDRPYATWPIETDEHLFRAIGYTHRNPVAAGLVARAVDWDWSSARTFAGIEPPPRPHLGCEHGRRLYDEPQAAAFIDAIADDSLVPATGVRTG